MPSPAQRLRELISQPAIEIMPGCHGRRCDARCRCRLQGRVHERLCRLGRTPWAARRRPHLIGEMLDSLRNCCAAASPMPLIGGGDTGYGNAINVQRTVTEYARGGAACVMIEDQVSPECGHTRGKQVISRDEARMKSARRWMRVLTRKSSSWRGPMRARSTASRKR